MKNTKLMVKVLLVISLFTSTILADGHMGGGGFTDDGHMGGGGKTCNPQTQTCLAANNDETKEDSILTVVRDFLASLIG